MHLLENILPLEVAILKYDKKQAQIKLHQLNQHFQAHYGIETDTQLRAFIRQVTNLLIINIKLEVYPMNKQTSKIQQDCLEDRVNYEQLLIQQINSDCDGLQPQKNQVYVGYWNNPNGEKLLKISQVIFKLDQQMILILVEEINENRMDELNQRIVSRDCHIQILVRQTMKNINENIGFLKLFMKQIQLSQQNQKQIKFIKQLERQVIENQISFYYHMNTESLIMVKYNQLKFNINTFTIQSLLNQLLVDFGFQNGTAQISSDIQQIIHTDKQKLVQVIISLVQFMKMFISQEYDNENFQLIIEPQKKNNNLVVVKLYHPKLQISQKLQTAFKKNRLSSLHNTLRWGINEGYNQIQNLTDILVENVKSETPLNQFKQIVQTINPEYDSGFLLSSLSLSQFLISQLGPYNIFHFKKKVSSKLLRSQKEFVCSPMLEPIYENNNSHLLIQKDRSKENQEMIQQKQQQTKISRFTVSDGTVQQLIEQKQIDDDSFWEDNELANQIKFYFYRNLNEFFYKLNEPKVQYRKFRSLNSVLREKSKSKNKFTNDSKTNSLDLKF